MQASSASLPFLSQSNTRSSLSKTPTKTIFSFNWLPAKRKPNDRMNYVKTTAAQRPKHGLKIHNRVNRSHACRYTTVAKPFPIESTSSKARVANAKPHSGSSLTNTKTPMMLQMHQNVQPVAAEPFPHGSTSQISKEQEVGIALCPASPKNSPWFILWAGRA